MVVFYIKSWSMSRKSEDREEKTPNVLKERFINLTSLYSCFKDLIKSRYFSFLRDMLVWRFNNNNKNNNYYYYYYYHYYYHY